YRATNVGGRDVFVVKLNATGNNLVYSTYLGGSADDYGWGGIAVDSAGLAYITGSTDSTNFPTANAFQPANAGGRDAFITKLSAQGNSLVMKASRPPAFAGDRKSTRLNSSHVATSYAVFCLKKKK